MFTVSIKAQGNGAPTLGCPQQVDIETQLTWLNMCVLIYQNLMSPNACYQATVFWWT